MNSATAVGIRGATEFTACYPKYSDNGHIVELRRDHIGFRCAASNQ
jgi:hypothetical protein